MKKLVRILINIFGISMILGIIALGIFVKWYIPFVLLGCLVLLAGFAFLQDWSEE